MGATFRGNEEMGDQTMAQDQVKLGPCPLCGGEALCKEGRCACVHIGCLMAKAWVDLEAWQALSALATQNRRLNKQNEDLFDTVLVVMRAAVGKSTITLRGSTEEQIQDLEKEVCSRGIKLSEMISALAAQNRRRGEALERCRRYFDDSMTVDEIVLSDEDWSNEAMAKMCEEALK